MKRTLLRDAKAALAAYEAAYADDLRGAGLGKLDDAMETLRDGIEAERLSSIERARASIFRRMTPEQRDRARERAIRTLAALGDGDGA